MANVFDEFDGQTPETNPFDSFDTPTVESPTDTFAQHLGKKITQGSASVVGGFADLNAFGGRAMRSIYGSLPGLDESITKSTEVGKGMRAMASDRELGVGTDDMRLSKGKRYAVRGSNLADFFGGVSRAAAGEAGGNCF